MRLRDRYRNFRVRTKSKMYSLSAIVEKDWPKITSYAKLFSWQLLILAVLVGILWKVPIWQTNAYRTRFDIKGLLPIEQLQREQSIVAAENNARVTLAQIFAGGFLLLGLYFTWRNLSITEEGKLTDRFSSAVELLGNATLSVRLGGIYALERIARDSQKDHWTVMEILTGFVRENSRGEEPIDVQASSRKLPLNDSMNGLSVAFPAGRSPASPGGRKPTCPTS